jgi:hypothetical protein
MARIGISSTSQYRLVVGSMCHSVPAPLRRGDIVFLMDATLCCMAWIISEDGWPITLCISHGSRSKLKTSCCSKEQSIALQTNMRIPIFKVVHVLQQPSPLLFLFLAGLATRTIVNVVRVRPQTYSHFGTNQQEHRCKSQYCSFG